MKSIKHIATTLGILSFFMHPVWSQPYEQSPKLSRQVHQITEWTRPGTSGKVVRGGLSTFDKQGKLIRYFSGADSSDLQSFRYDRSGRLVEHIERSGDRRTQRLYVYKKDVKVEEVKFRDRLEKTFVFYKKGRKVESKSFVKGEELGNKMTLKSRVVYNYDQRDSLKGEMHYAYPMRSKRSPLRRKTLYRYDPAHGRRTSVIHYDFDGSLRMSVRYQYDRKGRLKRLDYLYPQEGPGHSVVYQYRDGQLWQVTEESDFRKYVMIYKNRRLIRTRTYQDDKMIRLTDYQYTYY